MIFEEEIIHGPITNDTIEDEEEEIIHGPITNEDDDEVKEVTLTFCQELLRQQLDNDLF